MLHVAGGVAKLTGTSKALQDVDLGAGRKNASVTDDYKWSFSRDEKGVCTVDSGLFAPVVRSVPVFADHAVNVGDTWVATGEEAEDLRRALGVDEPFIVPFNAIYTYKGKGEGEYEALDVVEILYDTRYEVPAKKRWGAEPPQAVALHCKQTLWWNNEIGYMARYDKDFRVEVETVKGKRLVFKGAEKASVSDYCRVVPQQPVETQPAGMSPKPVLAGVVHFLPDSDLITLSGLDEVKAIANKLQGKNGKVLITGHCAAAGNERGRPNLSVLRAKAVADELLLLRTVDRADLQFEGHSDKDPVASNGTWQGQEMNRRAEVWVVR